MKATHVAGSIVGFICLSAVPLLLAHHGTGQADRSKVVTLSGVISKVEWMNPHAHVYIDVKNDEGKTENWALSWGAPNSLIQAGVNKETLKPTVRIMVETYLYPPGYSVGGVSTPDQRSAEAGCVTLDGRKISAGMGPGCSNRVP